MMGCNDLLGDRETQAEVSFRASGLFGAVEAVENMFFVGIGDTDACIGDRYFKQKKIKWASCLSINF